MNKANDETLDRIMKGKFQYFNFIILSQYYAQNLLKHHRTTPKKINMTTAQATS